jgi:hypothetical protein
VGETENRAALERVNALLVSGDIEAASRAIYELSSEDFVQLWPQSGELIRGRENLIALNKSYQTATGMQPKMGSRRISGSGDMWVIESTIDYGDGTLVSYVGIWEFRGGKVARVTEYFANPFPAPEWRAKWVERTDMAGAKAG